MLEQPIVRAVRDAKRILIAGCGGGYDVFGAVPILVELMDAGREVHLANLSFACLSDLPGAIQQPDASSLYEVPASAATTAAYCPEAWLARWLEERLGRRQPVWAFEKSGVRPLRAAYRRLVHELEIDCVLLVDGGTNALLRGDEPSLGTSTDAAISLAAASGLNVPRKVLASIGFGAGLKDGVCHAHVLERIAELSRIGGYLGVAALVGGTRAGDLYDDALQYTFANQGSFRRSHLQSAIRASMLGGFGTDAQKAWLSPLQSMFWFFSLDQVVKSHLLLGHIHDTNETWEATARMEGARKALKVRERTLLPL